jgi:hypothetical protein
MCRTEERFGSPEREFSWKLAHAPAPIARQNGPIACDGSHAGEGCGLASQLPAMRDSGLMDAE